MSTPYEKIYNSFLSKIREDEWSDPDELNYYEEEWKEMLHTALSLFKFPRFNLNYDDEKEELTADLTIEEINILANLMKQEWLDKNILTWDQIKTMYDERDFSQANMLRQLINAHDMVIKENYRLQKIYSRSILDKNGNKTVFDYRVFGCSNGL
jgi:hypothetical protein